MERDTDSDGIYDGAEVFPDNPSFDFESQTEYETDPTLFDSDGDGYGDKEEQDGVSGYELDPTTSDTDGDGLAENLEIGGWEVFHVTRTGDSQTQEVSSDPTIPDSNDDGMNDYQEFTNISRGPGTPTPTA